MKKLNKFILAGLLIASIAISSCTTTTCPDPTPAAVTISKTEWVMSQLASPTNLFYSPRTFVSGGIAKFPATIPHTTSFQTDFLIDIPQEIVMNAQDTVKLVARIDNTTGDPNSHAVGINIITNTDSLNGAAWETSNAGLFYAIMRIGADFTRNVSELIVNTSTYNEYAVEIIGGNLNVYFNGTLVKTKTFTGNIGRVTGVIVGGRGAPSIDWVKIYKGSKLIMSEDFNTTGKTSAVWTMP